MQNCVLRKDEVINVFHNIKSEINGVWGFGSVKTAASK